MHVCWGPGCKRGPGVKSWGAWWAWHGPLSVPGPSRCAGVQEAPWRGERESFCAPSAPPPPDPSAVRGLRPQVGEGTAEHNGPELSQVKDAGRAEGTRTAPIAPERPR